MAFGLSRWWRLVNTREMEVIHCMCGLYWYCCHDWSWHCSCHSCCGVISHAYGYGSFANLQSLLEHMRVKLLLFVKAYVGSLQELWVLLDHMLFARVHEIVNVWLICEPCSLLKCALWDEHVHFDRVYRWWPCVLCLSRRDKCSLLECTCLNVNTCSLLAPIGWGNVAHPLC